MSIFSDRAEPWTGLIRQWRSPLTRADNNEIHFQPKKTAVSLALLSIWLGHVRKRIKIQADQVARASSAPNIQLSVIRFSAADKHWAEMAKVYLYTWRRAMMGEPCDSWNCTEPAPLTLRVSIRFLGGSAALSFRARPISSASSSQAGRLFFRSSSKK